MVFHSEDRSWNDFRKTNEAEYLLSVCARICRLKWKKTVTPNFVKHFLIDGKVLIPCVVLLWTKFTTS